MQTSGHEKPEEDSQSEFEDNAEAIWVFSDRWRDGCRHVKRTLTSFRNDNRRPASCSIINVVDVKRKQLLLLEKKQKVISPKYETQGSITMLHVIYFVLPVLSSIFGFVGKSIIRRVGVRLSLIIEIPCTMAS